MDLKILKKIYLESENQIILDKKTYFKLSESTKDKLSRDVSFRPSGEILISKIIRLYPPYLEIMKKEKPDKIIKIQKNGYKGQPYEVEVIDILDFLS